MKIAILITTFFRDDLLLKAVESMQIFCPQYQIIIGDQNPTEEKQQLYQSKKCIYDAHPFNCGLSESRNRLVTIASTLRFEYVILASDSFIFDNRTRIDLAIPALETFDIVGMFLENCKCYWVGDISLIPNKSFHLDFYNRNNKVNYKCQGNIEVLSCSIIHNFFIAKTEVLVKVPWDNYLVMAEHEDEFLRLKESGYKVCWTPCIRATKITSREGQHGKFRSENWQLGLNRLLTKYSLKKWISYQNLGWGKTPQIYLTSKI